MRRLPLETKRNERHQSEVDALKSEVRTRQWSIWPSVRSARRILQITSNTQRSIVSASLATNEHRLSLVDWSVNRQSEISNPFILALSHQIHWTENDCVTLACVHVICSSWWHLLLHLHRRTSFHTPGGKHLCSFVSFSKISFSFAHRLAEVSSCSKWLIKFYVSSSSLQ